MSKLCRRIRYLRRRHAKITQKQLADLLGVTRAAVCNWERGLNLPTAAHLPAIAKALGVSMASLYGEA